MIELTISDFLNRCNAQADFIREIQLKPGTDYLVLFEQLDVTHPAWGAKTIVAVGEAWGQEDPEFYRGRRIDFGEGDGEKSCIGLVYVGPMEPDYNDPLWMFDTVAEMRRMLHGYVSPYRPVVETLSVAA